MTKKNRPKPVDWASEIRDSVPKREEIFEQLGEESDLGVVLISASLLDSLLQILIKAFLIDDPCKVDTLFDGNHGGPLQSLAAKAKIAYCLGLIDETQYANLETIKNIRNHFAHGLLKLSFGEQEIQDILHHLGFRPQRRHTQLWKSLHSGPKGRIAGSDQIPIPNST